MAAETRRHAASRLCQIAALLCIGLTPLGCAAQADSPTAFAPVKGRYCSACTRDAIPLPPEIIPQRGIVYITDQHIAAASSWAVVDLDKRLMSKFLIEKRTRAVANRIDSPLADADLGAIIRATNAIWGPSERDLQYRPRVPRSFEYDPLGYGMWLLDGDAVYHAWGIKQLRGSLDPPFDALEGAMALAGKGVATLFEPVPPYAPVKRQYCRECTREKLAKDAPARGIVIAYEEGRPVQSTTWITVDLANETIRRVQATRRDIDAPEIVDGKTARLQQSDLHAIVGHANAIWAMRTKDPERHPPAPTGRLSLWLLDGGAVYYDRYMGSIPESATALLGLLQSTSRRD